MVEQNYACTVTGTGVMSIGQKCIMKSGNLELAAENEYESEQQLIIHPSIDIAKHIETSTKTPRMMEMPSYNISNDLDELQKMKLELEDY
ncbi:hypothetical protein Bhyg_04230 [Pseudolycoriella hygida]|uniref:Uncharacterized protein n=1 Tax=Pseudolycoriella hygida TaxID=35572 RepID=A0A9Q0S9F5_9DIPT|nr:hypothetical protein Bhyg_04230 [Pseudolycoriella hygida]